MSCLTIPRTEKSTCYAIHYVNPINNMITTSFIPKFYTLGFKRLNISLCPGISPTLNRATHNPIFKHDPSKPSYLNRTILEKASSPPHSFVPKSYVNSQPNVSSVGSPVTLLSGPAGRVLNLQWLDNKNLWLLTGLIHPQPAE